MIDRLLISLLAAYLLGSLPFAVWISKITRGIDPRRVGDGNAGTRNVFLNVGRMQGILTGVFDISKGCLAIQIGRWNELGFVELLVLGVCVVLGHNWSIFLRFGGGQGMATTFGVFLGLDPLIAILSLMMLGFALLICRNWDWSCGVSLVLIPILFWLWKGNLALAIYAVFLIPLIGIRKWLQRHPPGRLLPR